MITRALVTGGAGFVGSHIVEALLERGDQVSVIDNLDSRVHGSKVPRFSHDVDFIRGDILSPTALSEALKGQVDVVFHEASMVGFGRDAADAESYVSVNVIGTVRLMDAIARRFSSRPRFILASSMAIYGEGAYECKTCGEKSTGLRRREDLEKHDWEPHCNICGGKVEPVPVTEEHPPHPSNIYAITKLNQELFCMNLGRNFRIPVVALRYHNVYGPRMPRDTPYAGVASIFKSRLLAGHPPLVYEDGRQLRDFIHVDDIVQANLLAADTSENSVAFEAFNVGTGQPHQVSDFARELAKSIDSNLEPEFPGLFRHGDVRHVFANISKIRRLGFAPRVSFEDGVSRFAHESTREPPTAVVSS
jgi:dTDP-L-rhamnose 4-epimerase